VTELLLLIYQVEVHNKDICQQYYFTNKSHVIQRAALWN